MNQNDLLQLKEKGISLETFNEQLASFKSGFPYLIIEKAASIDDGIKAIDSTERNQLLDAWNKYLSTNKSILKFVPASGAASRMFKDLFEFIESEKITPVSGFEKKFFEEIEKFAFYDDLDRICIKNEGKNISALLAEGKHKAIIINLLDKKGLNYGNLPKGLLKFHNYSDANRTPLEEHLVEGALYSNSKNKVEIHFTVSKEHRSLFEQLVSQVLPKYEKLFNVTYHITFSEQKPSTDTVAADENNEPFRDKDKILFRPGGHGALIENLNDLNADVVFIKNIDNVVPDRLKEITVTYKKVIAGLLVHVQEKTFAYLNSLDGSPTDGQLSEINEFCCNELNNKFDGFEKLNTQQKISYLKEKLNRPIRVCGMVKNEGEPGGGPYLIINKDGSISPQILESSQIDTNNPKEKALMMSATHFNPVDLVCAVKDYTGNKFDLTKYVDKSTGFISSKSKSGKELKALELPGLWNGAMSNWNTIFVEVPIETFNPVKTVNDLLRKEHQ
jgi:hypothetical protein